MFHNNSRSKRYLNCTNGIIQGKSLKLNYIVWEVIKKLQIAYNSTNCTRKLIALTALKQ